jgi:cellulose biosynthesis protein BcsQ
LCSREGYDLVIVDSGHGNVMLLLALLEVCSHLVVPTREDAASIKGVRRLAASYTRAKQRGSQITLLGVALFQVNPRATVRNREITDQIREMLDGSDAEPFTAAIRHAPGPALAERHRHLAAEELVAQADTDKSELLAALREGRSQDVPRLHASDPIGVANDYQELTRQILIRMQRTLVASAS